MLGFAFDVTGLVRARQAVEAARAATAEAEAQGRRGAGAPGPGGGAAGRLGPDLAGDALVWRARCLELLGPGPDASASRALYLRGGPPEDVRRVEGAMRRALAGADGGALGVESRVYGLEDHVERWLRSRGQAHHGAQGRPLGFVGVEQAPQKQTRRAEEAHRAKVAFMAMLGGPSLLVIVTGHGQAADRARSATAGFHEHLVKPVAPGEVAAPLARRLAGATT